MALSIIELRPWNCGIQFYIELTKACLKEFNHHICTNSTISKPTICLYYK